ncbi:MAG: dienelactone hydrolase family protein [Gammaproteobacteria bacterium]|nr:dienelactone hydrolase family protein [Gammaproteobacteria bacterium]
MTSELIESWIPFQCRDGFDMRAWWVRPATPGSLPGILFVYEPFGINPEMKRVAGELASEGYIVMIPDLLQRGSFFRCIRQLMADLKAEKGRSIDDLLDARQALVRRPDVLADRVAVMGLCMGGGFALILAKTGLFRVSAPFYGQAPVTLDGACPIVASYGGRDRVTAKHAKHLAQELKRAVIAADFKVYPSAGHSFMTRPANLLVAVLGPLFAGAGFDPDAAADSKRRLVAFFREHL